MTPVTGKARNRLTSPLASHRQQPAPVIGLKPIEQRIVGAGEWLRNGTA